MHKKTKIVCTIGPASESLETLVQLLQNGMNVARLNFSHGTQEEHGRRIDTIRKASQLTEFRWQLCWIQKDRKFAPAI